MSCEYCREARRPLFRILESYSYDEIDVYGECENCDSGAGVGETYDMEAVCNMCEYAPVQISNNLNLTIYVNGTLGEIVFEDKVQQCQKYHKLINFCPMCGEPLTEPEPLSLEALKQMDGDPVWIEFPSHYGVVLWAEWRILGRQQELVQGFKNKNSEWIEDYGKTWLAYPTKPRQEN